MNTPETTATRTQWAAVATFAFATLIVASELSLTGLALPSIADAFSVGAGAAAWVTLAYSLPLAALAIPAGRWADKADLRLVFTLSLSAVGLTSVLAVVMPTFAALLAARVAQGMASAAYLAVYLPVVAAAVREDQRGRAMSAIATIMMLGSMAIAPLGGFVATAWGWQAVFLIKVPLLAAVILMGLRTIPLTPTPGARLPLPDRSALAEVVLLGGSVTALLVLIDQAGHWRVSVPVAIAAVVLAVLWLRMPGSAAIIALVRQPVLGLAQLALLLTAAMIGLITFLLPFYLAEVMVAGPEVLGIAILWFVAAAALLAPLAGYLADRIGPLPVAAIGAVLSIAGLATMFAMGPNVGVVGLSWRLAIIGAGGALFNAPAMTAILAATPTGQAGAAGGVTNVARTLGNLIGPAAVAAAWSLGGGGRAGFTAGNAILVCGAVAALMALLAARTR
jgi:DHA2 family multidrug resistance protein-like MFS transporter